MDKILLLSSILVSLAVPIRAAREPDPRRALRRAVGYVAAYNAFYLFALLYVYPRITS